MSSNKERRGIDAASGSEPRRIINPITLLPLNHVDRIAAIQSTLSLRSKSPKDQLTEKEDQRRHKEYVQLIEEADRLFRLPWPTCDLEEIRSEAAQYNYSLEIDPDFNAPEYRSTSKLTHVSYRTRQLIGARYRHSYCIHGMLPAPLNLSHLIQVSPPATRAPSVLSARVLMSRAQHSTRS
jgi:hypothetical protein